MLNIEATYKPQNLNNKLKPPKHTTTSKLRQQKFSINEKSDANKLFTEFSKSITSFDSVNKANLEKV